MLSTLHHRGWEMDWSLAASHETWSGVPQFLWRDTRTRCSMSGSMLLLGRCTYWCVTCWYADLLLLCLSPPPSLPPSVSLPLSPSLVSLPPSLSLSPSLSSLPLSLTSSPILVNTHMCVIAIYRSRRATLISGSDGGRTPSRLKTTSSWPRTTFPSTLWSFPVRCSGLRITIHCSTISVPQVRIHIVTVQRPVA